MVAWNASFESQRLVALAAAAPHLAEPLEALAARVVDLLPVVRKNVYHPDFGGSFGMKAVLPALVPDLSYAGMEVPDDQLASFELERLLLSDPPLPKPERDRTRQALLEYCRLDTLGMLRIWERLRELARE